MKKYLNTNTKYLTVFKIQSFEKVLKILNTKYYYTSKPTMRTNVRFQNYFYYANQIITILITQYSVSTVSNYI